MKKRIISLFLVLSMLLCVLPAASADEMPGFFGTYLTLNESIDINFVLTKALPDGCSVKFSIDGVACDDALTVVKERDGKPVYTYTGLTPRTLGQSVTATIYNGETATNVSYSRSVLEYCTSMLGKNSTSGNLKTLLVDLLNYGAAFQTYKNDTTALANATLTDTQKGFATRIIPTMTNDLVKGDETDCSVTWASASLTLENSVRIRFDANEAANGKTLKVFDGETLLGTATFAYNEKDATYSAYFDKLNPAQMRKVVTAQVFDGENAVSSKLTYSIESYAYYQTNNADATDNLKTLVKQMMRYGDSTAAWVKDPTGTPETPVVASVEILSGNSVSVILPFAKAATVPVIAVAKDAKGRVIEGETLTYSIKDTSVATVDASGTLTRALGNAVGDAGTTTLSVSCGNSEDTITVFAVRRWETFDTPNENYSGQAYSNWINVNGSKGVLRSGEGEYARSGKSHAMVAVDDVALRSNSDTFKFYDTQSTTQYEDLGGKTIAFWIYDMGENTAFKAVFSVAGGLGVDPDVSKDCYVSYAGNNSNEAVATQINRSVGWHEFRFVFGTPDENQMGTVEMYIDGKLAATNSDVLIPVTRAGSTSYDPSTMSYHLAISPLTSGSALGIYLDDLIVTFNEK